MIVGLNIPDELLDEFLAMEGRPMSEVICKLAEVFEQGGRAEDAARLREARYDVDRATAILEGIAAGALPERT